MKTLHYHYVLRISFDSPVQKHNFTVRCIPQSDARQRVIKNKVHILPNESLQSQTDSFGNRYIYGKTETPHQLFEVVSDGEIETGACYYLQAEPMYRLGMYLNATKLTRAGDGLREFLRSLDLDHCPSLSVKKAESDAQSAGDIGPTALEKSQYIMNQIREHFKYASGSTNIQTTAEQAWQQGMGVCQDYSHIMLCLCRMAGIPARYVAGFLIGEGQSHAWVEVVSDGRWWGLDPTNGIPVLEDHIKVAHGRDYRDCLLNQGYFIGSAAQSQTISVVVAEV